MNKTALFIIVGFAILILGGMSLVVFLPSEQSIAPSQCELKTQGSVFNTYKCPDSAGSCDIKISLFCNTQVTTQKIVFRGSSQTEIPQQIAIDSNNDGALESFSRGTSTLSNCPSGSIVYLPEPFQSSFVFQYNSKIYVCSGNKGYNYVSGGSISTSSSPLSNEACDGSSGFIRCAGDINTYQCSQSVTGSITKIISYSGSGSGFKNDSFTINKGQTINWNGKIEYTEKTIKQSECTNDVVDENDPSVYYSCVLDNNGCGKIDRLNPNECAGNQIYNEVSHQCSSPYKLTVTPTKLLFSTSEEITGKVVISDTTQKVTTVKIILNNNLDNEVFSDPFGTNAGGEATFNLGKYPAGQYSLIAQTENHPLGDGVSIPVTVNVAPPVFLTLAYGEYSKIQSTGTISIKALTTSASGSENIKSFDYTGTKCGSKDMKNYVTSKRINNGEYIISTPVNEECEFVYKIVAVDDSGFRSDPQTLDVSVKKASIIIDDSKLQDLQDGGAGRYTTKFTTLNTQNQPIATQNEIIITEPNGCKTGEYCSSSGEFIPTVLVTGANGFYEFSYTWKVGGSVIKISSSAQGLDSATKTKIINIFDESVKPCESDNSCPPDDFPYGLIVGGIAVLGAGVFFFWLIFRRRK